MANENNTFNTKQYLNYEGLIEVFKLVNNNFYLEEEVDFLSDTDIDDTFCEVFECPVISEEPIDHNLNGKVISITWGENEPLEIEPVGNLNSIKVTVDDKPKDLENAEIVESTILQLTMKEKVDEGIIRVMIPKGTIRIVETGEVNNDEEFEYEVIPLPNSEIWYKTSDNQPVTLNVTTDWGTTYVSNTYDPADDCCKLKFDGDIISTPNFNYSTSKPDLFAGNQKLTEIIHLPSTIETIGSYFLHFCTNLQSVNLSNLYNVTTIEDSFMTECKSLQSLSLSGLNSVTSVGKSFLSRLNITSITFEDMPNLEIIGGNFLGSCEDLTSIDLSSLTGVTSIGNNFLTNCTGLTKVILPPSVTSIGTGCFSGSTAITYLETPMLTTNIHSAVRGNLTTLVLNGDTVIGNLTSVITSPNAGLKVYVKKTLLANYKSTYSAWQSRFLTIEDDLS